MRNGNVISDQVLQGRHQIPELLLNPYEAQANWKAKTLPIMPAGD